MELILVAIAVVMNVVFIKWKYSKGRYADATLDLALMLGIMFLFHGSFSALAVGTIASAMISIYLFFSPPKIKAFF